jgi:opacity protein-like surface antigen
VPGFLVGSGSEDDSDLSYRVGASFKVSETVRVNAEYMYWMEFEDTVDVEGLSLGLKYFF